MTSPFMIAFTFRRFVPPLLRRGIGMVVVSSGLSSFAWAGPGDAGGGNAVVCFSEPAIAARFGNPQDANHDKVMDGDLGKITSIQTYDLIDAERASGLERRAGTPVLPLSPQAPIRQYTDVVAQRFAVVVPGIAQMIRDGAGHFPDRQIQQRRSPLTRVHDENDIGDIADPEHCVIATMATQYKTGEEYFLQIDERLFFHPAHSDLSRAVLFLHEALYSMVHYRKVRPAKTEKFSGCGDEECPAELTRESEAKPQANSRNTRNLVRALISAGPVGSVDIVKTSTSLGFFYNGRCGAEFDHTSHKMTGVDIGWGDDNRTADDCTTALPLWAQTHFQKLYAMMTGNPKSEKDMRQMGLRYLNGTIEPGLARLTWLLPAHKAAVLALFKQYIFAIEGNFAWRDYYDAGLNRYVNAYFSSSFSAPELGDYYASLAALNIVFP